MLAAGAQCIVVFPIMPRDRLRNIDVSRSAYRHRRHLNKIMGKKKKSDTRLFSAPVFRNREIFYARTVSTVHPAEAGWMELIAQLLKYV